MNCPSCNSEIIKLNGHIHNGKQNHRCLSCGRQFVEHPTNKVISEKDKELLNRLLSERISLAGIARSLEVSEIWLQGYISKLYASQPDDLYASIPDEKAMQEHLSDKFDRYISEIEALKKRCTA